MSGGWIKLHRKMLDSAVNDLPAEQKWLFITILLLASHKENDWIWQGESFRCCPGQLITSLDKLAQKTGLTKQTIRTGLKNLENLKILTNESTKTGRLITVENYTKYQGDFEEPNKQLTHRLTNSQQTANTPANTYQEERMYKNDKKKQTIAVEALNSLSNPYEGLSRTQTEDAEHYAYRLEKLGGCDSRLPEIVAEWVIRYDSSDIGEAVTSAERGRARNPVAYVRKILSEKESKADRERREREACTKGGGTWL